MATKRFTKTEIITIISLLIPYIFILVFLRQTSVLTFLLFLLFSGLFILTSLAILLFSKETRKKKVYYFLAAVLSVTIFILSYGQLINISDRIYFALHKSKMTEVVTEIKKAKHENRQIAIPRLKFALVDTLEDGTIIFTIDGILDNCVGVAYSEDNVNPGYTNCGRLVEWRRLEDHWYFWYST